MIRTWKVKGRGMFDNHRVVSSAYFIKNNCVSCGWGLPDVEDRHLINNFKMYKNAWHNRYGHEKKWSYQGVHHLFESVKKGDYIWTRLNGIYYVAEVPDDPKELFYNDLSREALEYDAQIQLKNIIWKKVGTEESVPGSVSTFSSNRNSIVKVDNNETEQQGYSITSLFSKKALNPNSIIKINDKSMIFRLIEPSGLEDIIALWLYDKYGYIVIPSTNKKSTQTYEYVMIDTKKENGKYLSHKRIYLQAKNGNNNLMLNDYLPLLDDGDEIWLVTTLGNIYNQNEEIEDKKIIKYMKGCNNIVKVKYDIKELENFIFDTNNLQILPKSIALWIPFFDEVLR